MATDRLILLYCASGPYRHAQALLESAGWFPWGYRTSQVPSDVRVALRQGTQFELWEVDDTRRPNTAKAVAVGEIDFVLPSAEYVALTLRGVQKHQRDLATSEVSSALDAVRSGSFVLMAPAPVASAVSE